jgi:hypothetical protein
MIIHTHTHTHIHMTYVMFSLTIHQLRSISAVSYLATVKRAAIKMGMPISLCVLIYTPSDI